MISNLLSLLGYTKTSSANKLEIRFHKDANYHGEHGQLLASHKKQGIEKQPIRFVFLGVSEAPKLDAVNFNYIWEEARAQGYIPHALVSYGDEVTLIKSEDALNVTVHAPEKYVPRPAPAALDFDVVARVGELKRLLTPLKAGQGSVFPFGGRTDEPMNNRGDAIARIYDAVAKNRPFIHEMHADVSNHQITLEDVKEYGATQGNPFLSPLTTV